MFRSIKSMRGPTAIAFAIALWTACATVRAAKPFQEPGGLRSVDARHYAIHTDIPDAPLVAELGRRMDLMYDQYCQVLRTFKPPANAPSLPVYLFQTKAKYAMFTGSAGSGGMFMHAGPKQLLTSYLDENGRDELRRTLQHEAFHQFAFFAVSENLPTWLNEGMAQLFEEGLWTGRDFLLGQIPARRLRQLQQDAKTQTLVTFDTFLKVNREEWNRTLETDHDRATTYYNEAWAIAYFLVHGPDRGYHKRLVDFLTKIHADPKADADRVFADCFPDVPGFQRAFERWAVQARPSPESTLLDRQDTLGDFLTGLAQDDPAVLRSMAQFRTTVVGNQMSMSYTRGRVKYETEKPVSLYFSNLAGVMFGEQQLYFQQSPGAPLPDIVCRPTPSVLLRTHFYKGPHRVEHESSIVPAR